MAQLSVYRVRFTINNAAGKVTSGPYTTFVGVSGGSRQDQHTTSLAASLATAVTNNLSGILSAMGAGSAPGQTVTIDSYDHASVPDLWT